MAHYLCHKLKILLDKTRGVNKKNRVNVQFSLWTVTIHCKVHAYERYFHKTFLIYNGINDLDGGSPY